MRAAVKMKNVARKKKPENRKENPTFEIIDNTER